ncbi:MAG: DUF2889 domain-containing protein [Parasphingopyxis sp.]|uniref:DUF2889 domain-containing protein n=1 Tax=Parasphingopyxis sp. TaxID=1920299 RepID=UPI0032ED69E5
MASQLLELPPAPASGAGPVPVRRPHSIRRVSAIDMSWPAGADGGMQIAASAYDLRIDGEGTQERFAEAQVTGEADTARTIHHLSINGEDGGIARKLTGARGGRIRATLREAIADEAGRASPTWLLLDDLAGATIVGNWALLCWSEDREKLAKRFREEGLGGRGGDMHGVCAGFRPGTTALGPDGGVAMDKQSAAVVSDLANPDDPDGWPFPARPSVPTTRRARHLDIWVEGDRLILLAGFQDSANMPDGTLVAVHEYRVRLAADRTSHKIEEIHVTPHVLPHRECPAAVGHVQALVGTRLTDLPELVPQRLGGIAGCTHLNDVLRGFGAIPSLSEQLSGEFAMRG